MLTHREDQHQADPRCDASRRQPGWNQGPCAHVALLPRRRGGDERPGRQRHRDLDPAVPGDANGARNGGAVRGRRGRAAGHTMGVDRQRGGGHVLRQDHLDAG